MYNPLKAYDKASWADYVAWLNRLGFTDVSYVSGMGVTAVTPEGRPKSWKTKKDIYISLLEMDGERYNPDA